LGAAVINGLKAPFAAILALGKLAPSVSVRLRLSRLPPGAGSERLLRGAR
jgi:hypothetical protein